VPVFGARVRVRFQIFLRLDRLRPLDQRSDSLQKDIRQLNMAASRRATDRAIASSRLTTKGQATIPLSVRKRLNPKPGDTVIFEESKNGSVRIRKAEPLDLELLSALDETLSEWNSDNDECAYRDL